MGKAKKEKMAKEAGTPPPTTPKKTCARRGKKSFKNCKRNKLREAARKMVAKEMALKSGSDYKEITKEMTDRAREARIKSCFCQSLLPSPLFLPFALLPLFLPRRRSPRH